jgi:hypothetical protein
MDMSPWNATALINGEWKDISISDEKLFEGLIKKYQKTKEEEEQKTTVKYYEEEEDEDEEE